ncbi:MAG TPA: hypothetical protein VFA08_07855 [Actinomycetota bacterium]|jgi:hypothetical protein|nr:hypothetical protein [Actinomycetota bacterium]
MSFLVGRALDSDRFKFLDASVDGCPDILEHFVDFRERSTQILVSDLAELAR